MIFLLFFIVFQGVAQASEPNLLLTPMKVKELLLTQGIGVQLLNLSLEAKKQDLPQAKSRFDTHLTLKSDHTIDESARTSRFFGSRTDTTHFNIGLEKKIPLGTTLGVDFLNERKEVFNPSSVTGTPSQPTYEPVLELKFQQPLGENFIGKLDRAEVEKTKRALSNLSYQTRHELAQLIVEAQVFYWEWVASLEDLKSARSALQAAGDFLKITWEKEKLGVVERTDRLGAQAKVSKRRGELSLAESQVAERESQLKYILNIPLEIKLRSGEVTPPLPQITQERALQHALENRYDFLAGKQALEEKEIQLVIAKQKKLPIIDLIGTLRLNEVKVGDYAQALGDVDNPKWSVGLKLELPLENKLGRGLKKQAEIERTQSLLELKQLEQSIILDISQKLKAFVLANDALKAQEQTAKLEHQKLDHALSQYRKARFSAELILQYQDDYWLAKKAWTQAKKNLALAILAWQQAANKDL